MTTPVVTTSPVRGVIALVAAIVGTVLMVWGFLAGIDAALDGSGSGPGGFVALFFIGAALVLVAIVVAVIRLIRGGSRALSWATIAVALLPIVAVLVLLVRARG